jgi:hypothetical protein
LAAVAVFQEPIRNWVRRPSFQPSVETKPPDCSAIPITTLGGQFLADSVYLRLWVKNVGKATAVNAEVYAQELRLLREDKTWERIRTFTPMNLKWTNINIIYFPRIAPDMGKHCDIGHIVDPARRHDISSEDAPSLGLTNQQTSLTFDLMTAPNNKGHIIGPGEYELDILLAAENAHPVKRTIRISLPGTWYRDEARMLRDGIGVSILTS